MNSRNRFSFGAPATFAPQPPRGEFPELIGDLAPKVISGSGVGVLSER